VETNEESGKNWDDARKSALVAQIVSGKLSVKTACQRHELSAETIQDWVRVFRRTTLQALDDHLRQTFLMQGVDSALLGSAEYTGTLDDIPIPDLIQTFQLGGKDGVISVTRDDERSQIWCEKGEIVDAESGRLSGEAALYRILDFDRGRVFADFRSEPRARTIELPSNVLLLEAARRKDECARLFDRLGGVTAIYRPAAGATAVSTTAAEREVLALCDGDRAIRDVLEESELGDLEGLAAIANLVDREYLLRDGTSLAPPESSRAIVLGKRTPTSVVSFSPLATSARAPHPTRRSGVLSAIVAGMLLGGLGWVGVIAFARRAPAPSSAASSSTVAPTQAPTSFVVDSSVHPPGAELWLDGAPVGKGHVRRELPRDGAPHELRVTLAGFAPTTLLFVDAPPPAFIQLEKLAPPPTPVPAPPVEPPAPSPLAAPSGAASPVAADAAAPRARRAPAANATKAMRPPAPDRPGSAAAAPQRPNLPRIQIIEDDTPAVQVIESP
jgi:hypothetical protein